MCFLTDMYMLHNAHVLQNSVAATLFAIVSPLKYTNDAMGVHDWLHNTIVYFAPFIPSRASSFPACKLLWLPPVLRDQQPENCGQQSC